MKRAGIGLLVGLWSAAGFAGDWTVDLRLAGGDFSSDMEVVTERVSEVSTFRLTSRDSVNLELAPASSVALTLRRFWSTRWASSLRVRHAVLDLDANVEDFARFEDLATGEVRESMFAFERPGSTEAIEVALGLELHPAPAGRLDPFFGISAGTIHFQGESQDAIKSLEGDLALGATVGIDVAIGEGDSYLSLAARWDSWDVVPEYQLFLGPPVSVVRQSDGLTAVTLEAGLGVRFGPGGD